MVSSLSFNAPTNFHQWKLSNLVGENETIFWHLVLWVVVMEERSLQTTSTKSYHCPEQKHFQKSFQTTKFSRVVFRQKPNRKKREREMKFLSNFKNSEQQLPN